MPTHATENLLAMFAAVEAALGELPELDGYTAQELTEVRADFLAALNKRGHVVGHATDRYHELQRRCAELLADIAQRNERAPGTALCPACLHGQPHEPTCPLEAIREIVAHPLHDPPPPQTRLGQASAEAFDRFAGQLHGAPDA